MNHYFAMKVVCGLILFLPILAICANSEPGLCLGDLVEVKTAESKEACVDLFRDGMECIWISFDQDSKACYLSKSCRQIVLQNQAYVHSSWNCKEKDLLFIAGGNAGRYSEIENFDPEDEVTCNAIPWVIPNIDVAGLINNIPTICDFKEEAECIQLKGGNFVSTTGYIPTSSNLFRQKNLHYRNGMLLVYSMDGYNQMSIQWKTSFAAQSYLIGTIISPHDELLTSIDYNDGFPKIGKVSEGPKLTAYADGTCEVLNDKYVLFMSNSYSSSQPLQIQFMDISNGIENSEWKVSELRVPRRIRDFVTITDPKTGHLYFLGGKDQDAENPQEQTSIYKLSSINGQWELLDQEMHARRANFHAFFASEEILPCERKTYKGNRKHQVLRKDEF